MWLLFAREEDVRAVSDENRRFRESGLAIVVVAKLGDREEALAEVAVFKEVGCEKFARQMRDRDPANVSGSNYLIVCNADSEFRTGCDVGNDLCIPKANESVRRA